MNCLNKLFSIRLDTPFTGLNEGRASFVKTPEELLTYGYPAPIPYGIPTGAYPVPTYEQGYQQPLYEQQPQAYYPAPKYTSPSHIPQEYISSYTTQEYDSTESPKYAPKEESTYNPKEKSTYEEVKKVEQTYEKKEEPTYQAKEETYQPNESSYNQPQQTTRAKREAEADPQQKQKKQDGQKINRLLAFVNQHSAQHCLARVICQLSANPNIFGQQGIQFATSLL